MIACLLQTSQSAKDYDYEYQEEPMINATRKFFFGGDGINHNNHKPSEYHYDDTLPFGKLEDKDTLTIEQFVNELKRRKEAKERQKQKQLTKSKAKKGTKSVSKKNVRAKKEQAKGASKQKRKPKSSSRPSKSKKQKSTKINQRKQRPKSGAIQKPRSTKTKKSKEPKPNKTKKKPEPKPSIKNKVEAKPSRKQKPFHKPKKDTKHKIKDQEDEDPFQIGNSNAHQHSDHHIHQHDHLEAHKHHHKHKASHSHSHDHSNDHEHNHKHTHNHVHNHIHKHNEAHEHTAEHAHTEKHHHKHLEYIDAGGWRRRNDEYSETMLEEDPTAIILEGRGLMKADPKDNVKNYLQKFIESYKTAASPDEDDDENNEVLQNLDEKENSVKIEKPTAFSKFSQNEKDSSDIVEELDGFSFDQDELSTFNKHKYDRINHHYDGEDDLTNEKQMALRPKVGEHSAEYDYNTGDGVQFAADYDDEEYSDYDDQIGYGSDNNIVRVEHIDFKGNGNFEAENNEIIPLKEMTLKLSDENQWLPLSEMVLERSDEGYMNNHKNSGSKGQTENDPGKTADNNELENASGYMDIGKGRSMFQDISYADYNGEYEPKFEEQNVLGIKSLDIDDNYDKNTNQNIDKKYGTGSRKILINVLKAPKMGSIWSTSL